MWFYRDGSQVSEAKLPLIVAGKSGVSGHLVTRGRCSRCGGAGGSSHWFPSGGICYRCNGRNSQTFERIVSRVFTAKRLAVLVAAAAKKEAKRLAAQEAKDAVRFLEFVQWGRDRKNLLGAIKNAEGNTFLADLARKLLDNMILSDRQLEAAATAIERDTARKTEAANSEWIGEIKVRMEIEVKVIFIKEFMGSYGPVDIIKMQDMDGNGLTWFCTGISELKRGDHVKIKATVKKHETYQETKQTVLTRCVVLETYTAVTPDEAANMEQVA